MKKAIALALVIFVLWAAGFLWALKAHASPQGDPDTFLTTIRGDGITGTSSDLLAIGKWVCMEVYENGFGRDQVAKGILDNPTNTISLDQAKFYVDTSVKYLCPNGEGVHHGPVRAV